MYPFTTPKMTKAKFTAKNMDYGSVSEQMHFSMKQSQVLPLEDDISNQNFMLNNRSFDINPGNTD